MNYESVATAHAPQRIEIHKQIIVNLIFNLIFDPNCGIDKLCRNIILAVNLDLKVVATQSQVVARAPNEPLMGLRLRLLSITAAHTTTSAFTSATPF